MTSGLSGPPRCCWPRRASKPSVVRMAASSSFAALALVVGAVPAHGALRERAVSEPRVLNGGTRAADALSDLRAMTLTCSCKSLLFNGFQASMPRNTATRRCSSSPLHRSNRARQDGRSEGRKRVVRSHGGFGGFGGWFGFVRE